MAGGPSLLVVKTGDADPLDVLFDTLRADEDIEFAADAPATLSKAKWLIRTHDEIAVVLIIRPKPRRWPPSSHRPTAAS